MEKVLGRKKVGLSSLGRWRRPASSGWVEVSPGVVREGGVECEIDRQVGAALAYRTFVVKKQLSRKAKLSIYWPVCTLTCGHEFWVATQSTRSQIRSAKNEFPPQGGGGGAPLDLRRVRSSKRSQLRWLVDLFQTPPGRLPADLLQAWPTVRRPWARPQNPPGRGGGNVFGGGSLCLDYCLRDLHPGPHQG